MKPILISAIVLTIAVGLLSIMTLVVAVTGEKYEPHVHELDSEGIKALFENVATYRLNDKETVRSVSSEGIQLAIKEAAYLYIFEDEEQEWNWILAESQFATKKEVDVKSLFIEPQDAAELILLAQNKFGPPAADQEYDLIAGKAGIRIWSIVARTSGAASFRLTKAHPDHYDETSMDGDHIFIGLEIINVRK